MNAELEEFYKGGPASTQEAFPPICLRTHWDPTMVVKYVLPQADLKVSLPVDPIESYYICTTYYNTTPSGNQGAPVPDDKPLPIPTALKGGQHRPSQDGAPFFPVGGAASLGFPYSGFKSDAESDLLRIDEPLTKCAGNRYLPPRGLPAPSMSTNVLPGSDNSSLSPALTEVTKTTGCREADDNAAWNRSSRLFFNPTKYDRTKVVPPGLRMAAANGALACPYNQK